MAGTPPPAPYPAYYPPPYRQKRRGCLSSCFRCLCCCCCFIFLIFLIQVLTISYFYLAYHPQIPNFTIQNITINALEIKPDSTLITDLNVSIRVENPNTHIGFLYGGDDSGVNIYYNNVSIAAAKLPVVRQGHQNTTVVDVDLKGNVKMEPEMQRSLTDTMNKKDKIVVAVKMEVPVNVFVGDVQMKRFKITMYALMAFDPSSPNKTPEIVATRYAVQF